MIYFAFRSGELPNQRHIKAFDADDVLDFFVKHWQAFSCHEGVKQLLGAYVYGFPIADYQSFDPVGVPKDFAQLVSIIEQYVYCNEVIGDNDCLQVLTDDDEIELAWYVFSDDYKNANLDKVALWFYDELPVALPKDEQHNPSLGNEWLGDVTTIDITANEQKCTYLMACTIYDSGNLEDITVKALTGVHLPKLPESLATLPDILPDKNGYYDYGVDVVQALQYFAKQGSTDIFVDFAKHNLESWQGSTGNLSKAHHIRRDTHCMEIRVNTFEDYHNYYVLFDDVWAAAYPDLAKSLLRFGSTWQI